MRGSTMGRSRGCDLRCMYVPFISRGVACSTARAIWPLYCRWFILWTFALLFLTEM